VKEAQRLDIAHTTNTEHTYILQAFHLPICVTTLPRFTLNILRACERAAGHYTHVLYFFSSMCITNRVAWIGQPSFFFCIFIYPWRLAVAVLIGACVPAGVDVISSWLVCFFARHGCDGVLKEQKHRTMRSLYFAHKDVEEGVPSKRWDGRNCTYGSVRSKGSTYYTILDELSRGGRIYRSVSHHR
jgi:hypothetical protein